MSWSIDNPLWRQHSVHRSSIAAIACSFSMLERGLRSLGIELLKDSGIRDVDIFITHCHLDHVSGLPFFAPFFRKDYRVRVWAGNLKPSNSIERVMRSLMSSPWFLADGCLQGEDRIPGFQSRRCTSPS